jgi:hypothetical protein
VVSSSNPQHAFDFGIVGESAKSFASSDVHAPESNGATEHGATVEASGSHTQSGRQGDQPSKSMPMPNQATSSDRAELANSFLSFEEMDRIAREKLQVIGQAQAVLREAFRDLDPILSRCGRCFRSAGRIVCRKMRRINCPVSRSGGRSSVRNTA